ncbi:putative efflux protein, MATE family [Octadecabacter temperatus]|uniref:Multidrug export protein MepA n=1 Tax=Octadecabacter temperatus TaxID=1458307 RepID=A0A0K0Y8B9_9RHOB|nr:MATE family efflux transporter [Octadecabacter temperatus]AKS47141.1 Multidrug export protein MepA [Octadecabacter temperatus]SIO46035.1 putative efflux protein, MATE family [Octadecabacter temperatus]
MSITRDLDLTQGPLLPHFRALAVPAAFGMLFSTLYNLVDVYWAGRLSTEAQAGLAIGFQAFFIMMAIGFGLGAAMSALVSNAKGSRDTSSVRAFALQGIAFGVIATLILMVLGWIVGPYLIALVSEPGGYRDAATGYFNWLVLSLPGFFLAYGANGILQAHGDTVTLQRGLIVAFFANVVLNPLLMFGVPGIWDGMGFNGIALSTVISQTGVMLWVLRGVFALDVLRDARLAELRPNATKFRQITAQLLPASTAMMVMFISGFVVQYALKGFGEDAIAAYGVALRIEQILLLPVLGMTGALLPIIGQSFGASDHQRVKDALFLCWKIGSAMSVFAMPLLWFGGRYAMGLFTENPAVIDIGASYLLVDGFLFPIYMMLFAINSFLQGLKRPIWTLWISVYRQGVGVALFIWLYVGVFGLDVWGVWFGIGTAVSTGWIVALLVARRVANQEIAKSLATANVRRSDTHSTLPP